MFDAEVLERQLRDFDYGVSRRRALLARAADRLDKELQRHAEAHRLAAAALLELFRQKSKLRALTATYGSPRGSSVDGLSDEGSTFGSSDESVMVVAASTFDVTTDGFVMKTPFSHEGPFALSEPIAMSVEEALALTHDERCLVVPGYSDLASLAQRQWMDHADFDNAVRRAAANGIIGECLADDLCGSIISRKVVTEDAACKRFAQWRRAHRESLRALEEKGGGAAS